MKTLAHLSIALAAVALILGALMKLGVPTMVGIGPVGLMKATMVFLLFGVNFELLELLGKK